MNNFFNLQQEQNIMISYSTFIYVNLFYITGFTIYKLYKNYMMDKLVKKNNSLLKENLEVINYYKNKTSLLTKTITNLNEEKSYLVSIVEDGETALRTNEQLLDTLTKYSYITDDYNVLKQKYDLSIDEYNTIIDKQEELINQIEELKYKVVDLEADIFDKDRKIEKLQKRVGILEKETIERKFEIIKLRKQK